jgi:ribosomal protein S18 acetylase RimI-like enzyme
VLEPFDDPEFSITRATREDAADVARLLRAAYAIHLAAGLNFSGATATPEDVGARIERNEVYVVRQCASVVATVTLRIKTVQCEVVGYVNALAVDPSKQRAGLGTALLARAEREFGRRGVLRMRLDTAKPAIALVGWYEARGYQPVAEVHWEGKTYESVVMEKQLGGPL